MHTFNRIDREAIAKFFLERFRAENVAQLLTYQPLPYVKVKSKIKRYGLSIDVGSLFLPVIEDIPLRFILEVRKEGLIHKYQQYSYNDPDAFQQVMEMYKAWLSKQLRHRKRHG
jgi:hypothetical protein